MTHKSLGWTKLAVVLLYVAVLALVGFAIIAFGTAAVSGQDYTNETDVGNGSVAITDPANETVWTDVEFAQNASNDRNVTVSLAFNGSEVQNETVPVSNGSISTVEFNVSQTGEYNVTVYGNATDVASVTVGAHIPSDDSDGGGLLPSSSAGWLGLVAAGLTALVLVIVSLIGVWREVIR